MFSVSKHQQRCEEVSFQEERDLAWAAANPSICFNVCKYVLIDGRVDAQILSDALLEAAHTHEALRTRFYSGGAGLYKRHVEERAEIYLEVADQRGLVASDESVAQRVREFVEHRFEADSFPLLRSLLLELAEGQSIFVICMSHAISDAASAEVLLADVGRAYGAIAEGRKGSLPAPAFTLSDFVLSHREWMRSDDYQQRLSAVGQKLLPGFSCAFADGGEGASALRQKARRARVIRNALPASAYQQIEDIAQTNKVSLPTALLAVSALTLSKITHSERFFFSFMFSNRHYRGLTSMVGHIANAVPLYIDMGAHHTAGNLVRDLHKTFLQSTAGSGIVPLGAVNAAVAGLDPVLSLRSPLNRLMVNISPSPKQQDSFAGMPLLPFANPYAGYISNDMQLHLTYTDKELRHACRSPEDQAESIAASATAALGASLQFAVDAHAPLKVFMH